MPEPNPAVANPADSAAASPAGEPAATATPADLPPRPPRAPFRVFSGASVRYSSRRGTVVKVRGTGRVPYEIMVRWDGQKHSEWHLHATLARLYERGDFDVVTPGKEPILDRLLRRFRA